MWSKIQELKESLKSDENRDISKSMESNGTTSEQIVRNTESAEVLRRIEFLVEKVMHSVSQRQSPALSSTNRCVWGNISFTEEVGLEMKQDATMTETRFDSPVSRRKFALMLKTLAICYKLIQTNTYSTKRDLFYSDPTSYSNQGTLNKIIDDISCMLKVSRNSLHVLATSKGCIAGNLSYTEVDGRFIDCNSAKSGILIPAHVEEIHNITSEAKFLLVVEKDATFQKLLDEDITARLHPCIVVTGKGYPDVHTRLMVKRLWDSLQIPVLGLVDADPHGLEILCVYKFGSKMQLMLEIEKKAEIQCLTAISQNFLTDVYLPSKLKCGGWI